MKVSANDNFPFALQYIMEGAIGAINYNKPAKRFISITLQRNNDRASLTFSDTGKDATKDEIYTGVGIERSKEGGILYFIARRIIFDHKGSLDVVPFNSGEGTTFKIELPLIA